VLRSHAEFGPLSHSPTALRSLANHLGDLFARSSPTEAEPIRVRRLHSIEGEVDALHRLNQAHVPQLGGLDRPDFAALLRCASLVRVVDAARPEDSAATGQPAAMMVAMRRDDDYDSPNFLWFREGFDNFAYVDRIATAARRSGIGSALYAVLEAWARTNEMTSIVCEVNLQPRNQGSIDFHRACGFREVGQKLSHGKPVAMMQKMLTP
jgi:predicted GNAT superfamily acetyltransferase